METIQNGTRSTVGSGTPHFNVSCQTCRISKTFVTLQGANAFFDDHEGHKVVEGMLFERPQTAKKPDKIEVSKPQAEEVREVLEGSGAVVAQEIKPEVEEVPEVIAERSPADKEPDGIAEEVSKPQVDEAPEIATESGEVTAQEIKPQVEEAAEAEVREETQAPLPPVTQPAEIQLKEPIAAAPSLLSEKDLEEPLLLARSSYIGESDEKRFDALRVSRALKEFKWNVEPPYVIGIMVDDNLSVETNIGVISSSMVERVEKLGYKFVAMNAPQGSPVAWFKREAQGALETNLPVGDAERMMHIRQGTRTYDKDKAVWQESFVSLLMTVKDMDGQKLQRVTDIIKSERPEPDLQS